MSAPILPGDLVEHIHKPELDTRRVLAVGVGWLWLDFQVSALEAGEAPTMLPLANYRKAGE